MKQRKTIRLRGFDYSSSEQYSITICSYLSEPLFGKINKGTMLYTDIGDCIASSWKNLDNLYRSVKIGSFIVMPNHFHGIITLINQNQEKADLLTLPEIIRSFKSYTAHEFYTHTNKRKLWQRGFYEHIIRDEYDLCRIENYITNNPSTWQRDKYYLM